MGASSSHKTGKVSNKDTHEVKDIEDIYQQLHTKVDDVVKECDFKRLCCGLEYLKTMSHWDFEFTDSVQQFLSIYMDAEKSLSEEEWREVQGKAKHKIIKRCTEYKYLKKELEILHKIKDENKQEAHQRDVRNEAWKTLMHNLLGKAAKDDALSLSQSVLLNDMFTTLKLSLILSNLAFSTSHDDDDLKKIRSIYQSAVELMGFCSGKEKSKAKELWENQFGEGTHMQKLKETNTWKNMSNSQQQRILTKATNTSDCYKELYPSTHRCCPEMTSASQLSARMRQRENQRKFQRLLNAQSQFNA